LRRKWIWFFALIIVIVCVFTVVGRKRMPAQSNKQGSAAALRKFEDDWWEFYLRNNPESATQLGEYKYNDKLSRFSPAYFADLRQQAAGLLGRLRAIDMIGASEFQQLDRQLLLSSLEDQIKGIDLKTYEMPVDQFNGVQIVFPQIPTFAPFDSVKHYEDYIARLSQIPERFDEVVEALKQGEKDGLLQPKFLLEKTVEQCKNVADPAGEANPFATPATQIPASFPDADKKRLHTELIRMVDETVRPAYRKFEQFLAVDYAPKGRTEPGYWSLPDGAARYRFAVHLQTTSDLTPEQIHALGLAQVKEIEAEIDTLGKKAGYPNGKAFTRAAMADPNTKAKSRKQILNNFRNYIGQMQPKLPQLFGLLPKAKVIVTSVPEYMEKEGSTEYLAGTPDGSRPGQVWVDTYDPTHHDMLDDEATAYHEGIPGHHMQISIAQELPGLHPFHRAMQYNAYAEGWALYAERLGKEVGFYQNPESDLGRLRSELFRGIRLVVDTGVHYKRWTRQQMVDFFNAHYGDCPQAEVDRYIAWPGQALGYKLGQLKILELRKKAHDELGGKFDIRSFHDEVLNAGALPLNMLDARVTNWVERQKSAH
jgi:uncharacterized protein (DUF885 family)